MGPLNSDDPVSGQPDVITLDLDRPVDEATKSAVEFLLEQFKLSPLNELGDKEMEMVVWAEMRTMPLLKTTIDKNPLENVALSVGGKDELVNTLPLEMREILLNLSTTIGTLNRTSFVGNPDGVRELTKSKNPFEDIEAFNLAALLLSECIKLDSKSGELEHTKPQTTYRALLALENETPGGHKVEDIIKKLIDERHFFSPASVYRYLDTLMKDEMVVSIGRGRYQVVNTDKITYDPYPKIALKQSSITAEE